MDNHTEKATKRSLGTCGNCLIRRICDGIPDPYLGSGGCFHGNWIRYPDEMVPKSPLFWDFWTDVRGLVDWTFPEFQVPDMHGFPNYVTMVRNGSRRISFMDEPVVALPFFSVVGHRKGGNYGSRYQSAKDLRAKFKLKPECRIVLVGVCEDQQLEIFWEEHLMANLAEELAALDIFAITAPNYSAFSDMSRMQIFRNLKRTLMACEHLSSCGVSVIPHLTAIEHSQWRLWAQVLREHPEIMAVTKEFQTGYKDYRKGKQALEEIARLQDQLGRSLHPILVGGSKLYRDAAALFGTKFTVIDSRPHMLAMARIQLSKISEDHYKEARKQTLPNQGVDDIYYENIRIHHRNMRLGRKNKSSKNDSCTSELPLDTSNPYLIAHPAA